MSDITTTIPDWLELTVWSAIAVAAVVGACVALWKFGPIAWLREQIADEASDRMVAKLHPVIADAVATQHADTTDQLNKIHATAIAAELKIDAHVAESKAMHAADLERREERQLHQDRRENDQERRLEHLEVGQTEILTRVDQVERLATSIARHEGVPVPELDQKERPE